MNDGINHKRINKLVNKSGDKSVYRTKKNKHVIFYYVNNGT